MESQGVYGGGSEKTEMPKGCSGNQLLMDQGVLELLKTLDCGQKRWCANLTKESLKYEK